MLSKLINLTLLRVIQGVEKVLECYPYYPYQAAFSIVKLRNELILNVLSQLPNYYALLEEHQELPVDSYFLYSSQEDRTHLENLIRKTMVDIFKNNYDLISRIIEQKKASNQQFYPKQS